MDPEDLNVKFSKNIPTPASEDDNDEEQSELSRSLNSGGSKIQFQPSESGCQGGVPGPTVDMGS